MREINPLIREEPRHDGRAHSTVQFAGRGRLKHGAIGGANGFDEPVLIKPHLPVAFDEDFITLPVDGRFSRGLAR